MGQIMENLTVDERKERSRLTDMYESLLEMENEEIENEEMEGLEGLKKYEVHKRKALPWDDIDSFPLHMSKNQLADESEINQFHSANELDEELLEMLHKKLAYNPETQSFEDFDVRLLEHLQMQYGEKLEQREENQEADEKELWQDLLDRAQNFHDDEEFFSRDSKFFRENIEGLYQLLDADIATVPLGVESRLNLIYSRTYDFVIAIDSRFSVFGENINLRKTVFDVCVFMGLCMFLHTTKRIRTLSRTNYIFDYAPQKYGTAWFADENKANENYINRKNCSMEHEKMEPVRKTNASMRAYVSRKHSARDGHVPNAEWSAIHKDMVYEWLLFFDYVNSKGAAPQLRDTLKRIGNLYQDVNEVMKSPTDDGYGKRLKEAYKKFQSKLSKIKYENYLELCKTFLKHIMDNQEYYGINLYRFEKEFALYGLTDEIKLLLAEKDESEKGALLTVFIITNGICFPKVRAEFCQYNRTDYTRFLAQNFFPFLTTFIKLSRLLVDKFIEDGALGKDWEALFLKKSNDMATKVLYDPATIDYSINLESQEMFELVLSAPVYNLIYRALEQWKNSVDFTQLSE